MAPVCEDDGQRAEDRGDFASALDIWQELATRSHNPDFYCKYGRAAEKLMRWNEAEKAVREALVIDPRSSIAMELLGSVYRTRLDGDQMVNLKRAKQWFSSALAIDRNARTLTFLGETCVQLQDLQGAKSAFEEAILLDPAYDEAYYNLALVEEKSNIGNAIALLEKAVNLDPQYAIAHQRYGVLLQKIGDVLKAEYHLSRSVELNPSDHWSRLYLANLFAVEGRRQEAEREYRAALAIRPDDAMVSKFFENFLASE